MSPARRQRLGREPGVEAVLRCRFGAVPGRWCSTELASERPARIRGSRCASALAVISVFLLVTETGRAQTSGFADLPTSVVAVHGASARPSLAGLGGASYLRLALPSRYGSARDYKALFKYNSGEARGMYVWRGAYFEADAETDGK